ncbi:hypothetical protein [Clostridium akagii]|uniref:hypothetical protein n=1 Tax=Clostridium akagii TaxID=91623 RepID=UPI000562478C|nr:hypothetical protein [Clostridium akagii]
MATYITFKDICSLDIKGVYIQTYPLPDASSPSRRVTKTPVAGRNGNLRILESDDYGQDVFDSIEKSIDILYKGDNLDLMKNWLRGNGKLILSNASDRYWKASIDNIISIDKLLINNLRTFTVVFSCFPYAFLKFGDTPIVYNPTTTTWETIIMNEYDLSLPHFKIYGQGDIGLLINGVETDFYAVDQLVECDSDLQQCYKGNQNLGMNMSGEFPVLYPGKNVIEFIGNIKQVILTPHWRTL